MLKSAPPLASTLLYQGGAHNSFAIVRVINCAWNVTKGDSTRARPGSISGMDDKGVVGANWEGEVSAKIRDWGGERRRCRWRIIEEIFDENRMNRESYSWNWKLKILRWKFLSNEIDLGKIKLNFSKFSNKIWFDVYNIHENYITNSTNSCKYCLRG